MSTAIKKLYYNELHNKYDSGHKRKRKKESEKKKKESEKKISKDLVYKQ